MDVQGFVKSLLDVGDNLERAASAVPEGALSGKGKDGKDLDPDHLVTLLTGLVNGVKLTEKIFDQVRDASFVLVLDTPQMPSHFHLYVFRLCFAPQPDHLACIGPSTEWCRKV